MKCSDCQTQLPLKILQSAAGYYLGYFCPECGPYGRISDYYTLRSFAEEGLKRIKEKI